jgi:DNA-directed RNA polymerase specialized sigma24 family protein
VSTRQESRPPQTATPARRRTTRRLGALDADEAVALIARARRGKLLGIHRHRLGREDLEDCYSQATIEMLARARSGGGFTSQAHIANALEQRFLSRVRDRRRAQNGRSPIDTALAHAIPLAGCMAPEINLRDRRADIERTILARHELRRIAALWHKLSPDQRLVLASRLSDVGRAEFCQAHGWSVEKYRKVIQRARARLRMLLDEDSRVAAAPLACAEARS